MEYDPQKIERDRMAPFVNWWKLDDPNWVKHREEGWRFLEGTYFCDASAKDQVRYKEYFLTGKKTAYIPPLTLFLMTPIQNIEQTREFFNSANFDVHDRSRLMSAFLILSEDTDVLNWYRGLAKLFAEGVMTKEFKVLEEIEDNHKWIYSNPPTTWCSGYAFIATKILKGMFAYHGYMELVDHFISALPHANDPEFRPFKKFDKFLAAIDDALENDSLSEDAKSFAQELKAKEDQIKAAYAVNAHLDG